MNEILNRFLLAGDKLMPEMHVKQPGFIYRVCGPFTKIKKELKSLCKMQVQTLFTKMNLIKLVFSLIWLMENQKIQKKRTQSDKVSREKAWKTASDPKYDGYQKEIASIFNFKSIGSGVITELNYQLANEFHKQVIKKIKEKKGLFIFQG